MFDKHSVDSFNKMLRSLAQLVSLQLNMKGLTYGSGANRLKFEHIKNLKCLQRLELELGGSELNIQDAIGLAHGINYLNCLRVVDIGLSKHMISNSSMAELARSLGGIGQLKDVKISIINLETCMHILFRAAE